MKILHVFDSLKFLRTIFVAVACAFFIFPAKSDDCVTTKIFQGEQYTEENKTEKTIMNADGTFKSNTNYYVTDYIPLKAGDYRFTIQDDGTGSRPLRLFLYNENHDIIAKPVSTGTTSTVNLRTFDFNVPTNCYARISARNSTTEKSLQPINPITYTEPCIKIATTKYNETHFTPVETDLDAARTVINDLITQMQTNAINVSKLAVEKQTRPNADCPAGKNCLLVTDPTGAENWYEIIGANAVQSSSNVPDYFSFVFDDSRYNLTDNNLTFAINASGTFTVDFGDGTTDTKTIATLPVGELPDNMIFTHQYATGGPKTVRITGRATGYRSFTAEGNLEQVSPIMFSDASQIYGIDGSLGAIFPTLGNADGQQPRFFYTFMGANILNIPENLFSGITVSDIASQAASGMFYGMFQASAITSIPENLFSGITGAARYMFYQTFAGTQITSIPENLFSGITDAAEYMFHNTFAGTQITSIPAGLFSGITDAADGMFSQTFVGTQITSIPAGLFSGITGAANSMFVATFAACSNLTGYIPESTFAGLIQNNSPDASGFMASIFASTNGLATACPDGTTEVSTPYKQYWSIDYEGRIRTVMCRPN